MEESAKPEPDRPWHISTTTILDTGFAESRQEYWQLGFYLMLIRIIRIIQEVWCADDTKGDDTSPEKEQIHWKGQVGSHMKFFNPSTNRTVIVPMHGTDLRKGTENAIIKQAGILK